MKTVAALISRGLVMPTQQDLFNFDDEALEDSIWWALPDEDQLRVEELFAGLLVRSNPVREEPFDEPSR